MEHAAVCLFCLTDNIFKDERSVLLFARAVKLGKQCELIVMPKAKWGPARDRLADPTPNTNPTRARARTRALSPTPTLSCTLAAPLTLSPNRPFPENVFNPTWKPYLPDLSPAFTTIAINWELEYKPACVLQVVERLVPSVHSPVDLQAARTQPNNTPRPSPSPPSSFSPSP